MLAVLQTMPADCELRPIFTHKLPCGIVLVAVDSIVLQHVHFCDSDVVEELPADSFAPCFEDVFAVVHSEKDFVICWISKLPTRLPESVF